MADDLMIEVTGSAKKAETALDRIIKKIDELQAHFDKAAPSVGKFAAQMDKIGASSKAFSAFQKIAGGMDKTVLSTKNAESRMAMYQARLDRANVSMEKSRVQSEKLAAAQRKLRDATGINAANEAFLKNFQYKGFPNPPAQTVGNTVSSPVPAPGSSRLASNILKTPQAAVQINTSKAVSEVDRLGAFIEGLNPVVSKMSQESQAKFNALSDSVMRVGQQVDNQRALLHNLSVESGQVARKHGENSVQNLRLEKRMISTDNAIQRLIDKQAKLKTEMSELTSASNRAGNSLSRFGNRASEASKKSTKGFGGFLDAFLRMGSYMAIFQIYFLIIQGITEGIQNMVLANSQANNTMSALSTNALYLKNSLAAALMPVLQALVPVLNQVTDALAGVFNTIGMLVARIFNHASTVTIAKRANVDYAATLDKTKKSADAAKKSLMGFDELNILNAQKASEGVTAPGMPAYSSMFETVKMPGWINKVGNFTDTIGKIIHDWWSGLTNAQKWGAGIGGTAGSIIGGIIGRLIGGPIGQVVGSVLGGVAGTIIGEWWAGLTEKEKWASGVGAGAGATIGAIIGGLIGGKIGAVIGGSLGLVIGGLIGQWWTNLTTSEKWSAGMGAGAGTVIGGIVGGILTGGNPIGIAVGAALIGTIGLIIGKFWEDLTTPQKWSVGIGAGAGAVIGGIIGGMIGGPIGAVVGVTLGVTIGAIIGDWWAGLTTKQKWASGVGAGAGATVGGIIGGLVAGPIGVAVGAALGGTIGTIIGSFWSGLSTKDKWRVGSSAAVSAIGAIIGTLLFGPLGTILGGMAGVLVNEIWKAITSAYDEISQKYKTASKGKGGVGFSGGGSGIGGGGGVRYNARGTGYHPGGPAIVNDQLGPVYQELVHLPNGLSFIPSGRDVLIPDLPSGSSVLTAFETKNLFPSYADGAGSFPVKQIWNQNDPSGNSGGLDTERIIDRMDRMEQAIKDIKVYLFTDDKKLADSVNRGNRMIARTRPTN